MDELISRQSVIAVLDKTKRIAINNLDGEVLKAFCSTLNSLTNIVDSLPSAQPEPHWIPVTEATPTEDDDYWCTFGAETGWFCGLV